jgi:hypothetical protein
VCIFLVGLASARAQTVSREYQVKAVFLFNFCQFVDWPAASFAAPDAPLVIGIIGDDPFGSFLEETIRGEKVGEHPLQVRQYQTLDQADCHMLFISRSESARLETLLAALAGKPVLTVSDADSAARRGVVIRFMTESNRLRLRINLDAARRAGLTVSSKLLRSAEIVGDRP